MFSYLKGRARGWRWGRERVGNEEVFSKSTYNFRTVRPETTRHWHQKSTTISNRCILIQTSIELCALPRRKEAHSKTARLNLTNTQPTSNHCQHHFSAPPPPCATAPARLLCKQNPVPKINSHFECKKIKRIGSFWGPLIEIRHPLWDRY